MRETCMGAAAATPDRPLRRRAPCDRRREGELQARRHGVRRTTSRARPTSIRAPRHLLRHRLQP